MNLNNFTSTTSLNLNDLTEKWMLNYPTILVKCKNTVVTWIIVSLQFSLVQLVRYKRALRSCDVVLDALMFLLINPQVQNPSRVQNLPDQKP